MKAEEILYTDGHEVTVTYSTILVKKKWYSLSSIKKHSLSIISPIRLPFIILLFAGFSMTMAGLTDFMPESANNNLNIMLSGILINFNELVLYAGIVVTLLASLLMLFVPLRYAVTITTAEGEKNLVVSKRKEHIRQIINALNIAILSNMNSGNNKTFNRKNYMVSAR